MSKQAKKFIIVDIDFGNTHIETYSGRTNDMSGVRAATVKCRNCSHQWNIGIGSRNPVHITGGKIELECPECGQKGKAGGLDIMR